MMHLVFFKKVRDSNIILEKEPKNHNEIKSDLTEIRRVKNKST